MKYFLITTIFTGLMILLPQANAVGMGWLKDAPIRYFSEKDNEIMMSTIQAALDDGEDGASYDWKNPDSGNFGSVMLIDKLEHDGQTCRHAQIKNSARGNAATSKFLFCRQSNGKWQYSKKKQ